MTTDLLLVLLLLGSAIAMFVLNRPRMDAVGLIMIVLLPLTGVLTVNEALAGFADASIILIAALFVIGEGLVRTGVARHMGDWLGKVAGGNEARALVMLMLAAAFLGAVMSSTAVVAIFIPIVLRLCQGTATSPRRLMMPLSVAALLSGMLTLIATAPNLMVNAELARQGLEGFGFFGITPFGLPLLAIAIPYMLLARRFLGGGTASATAPELRRARLRDWIELYDLPDREYRLFLTETSPLAGQRLGDLTLRAEGLNILAVERARRFGADLLRPRTELVLQPGDVLLADLQARDAAPGELFAKYGIKALPLGEESRYFTNRAQEIGMVEALVPADSPLLGLTILEARLQSEYGLTAIGLRRGRKPAGPHLLEQRLAVGDGLLLFGFWSDLSKLRQGDAELVLLNLPAEFDEVLPAAGRAPAAVACLLLTVGLMVAGVLPNVHAALIGCLLMGLFGCVDLTSAYRAINWKTLVLIVGMLPFSVALQRTGGVDLAADALLAAAGEHSPRIVLTVLFAVTMLLGLFISNTATAVLMAPVALAVAADLGLSPYPFAMTVALAASTAFMTPVSSPVNTLVVGPGNYSFGDFMKVGLPFSLLCMGISVVLVPWLLPLR
ncbi:SLC13 family permease [Roseicella frigidaeris]|uniref:SLC13 family permease n=1 Tax=Roseicella frigidaeris TaxID=2230885 RepID=A0A327MAP4_9PROT|nr:SLC13 family permease [Roseicella frigidaeris]RAI59214.1 SLC13 family permease [Roseicella frigidaeris]